MRPTLRGANVGSRVVPQRGFPDGAPRWSAKSPDWRQRTRSSTRRTERLACKRARKLGIRGGQPGAISYVQYFGSALQMTPHFHCIVPDGVFVEESETEAPEFHPLPPPADDEVEALLFTVMKRLHALLARKGLFDVDESRAGPLGALESLQHLAAKGQRSFPLPNSERPRPPVRKRRSAFLEGFSLHADLHLHENDREGLERLLLYAGRGALANDRLSVLPDGRVSYRMKRVTPDGRSHLVCSAVDFLRRLASITPPPRINLLRFHGVFAPNSRLRVRIVPAPSAEDTPPVPEQVPFDFAATVLAQALEGPERFRFSWAELMKRTFQTDVLECDRCGGRRRVTAFVTAVELAREVLGRLGLPSRSPPLAVAAGPPQLAFTFRN
ncbi:MAG: transposase [Candidatus Geothermincolia bacterium]